MIKHIVQWGIIIIFILTSSIACLSTDPPLPEGWRPPTNTETTVEQEWRDKDPSRYLVTKADFNGDGIIDQARLLIRETGSGLGLFAFVSRKDGTFREYLLDEIKDSRYVEVMGTAAIPPGLYKTACGKGYFDCGEGNPEAILLQHPAIDYFKEGSANSFFYWDETTEAFKRVWISD